MRRFLGLVVLVLFAVACYVNLSEAAATNPPNLVGTWSLRVKSVKLDVYQEHLDLPLKITSQQDFRFKGTSTNSEGNPEDFVGVIFEGQVYITLSGQVAIGKIFYYPKLRIDGVLLRNPTGALEAGVWTLTKVSNTP